MTHTPESLADWQPSPDLLRDRIILLTGAANGIGRALGIRNPRCTPWTCRAPARTTTVILPTP